MLGSNIIVFTIKKWYRKLKKKIGGRAVQLNMSLLLVGDW
jgi:hypothetical protein